MSTLQGYITADAKRVLGVPVYSPWLASHAAPGAVFDPAGPYALLPVIGHAVAIGTLNAGYSFVATGLTELENHRLQRSFDASLLVKRFAFEACDCYLALFYIAFELRDIPRLRTELIALYSTDTARRVFLETLLPLLLQWRAARASPRAGSEDATAKAEPSWGRRRAARSADLRSELELDTYDDFNDYLEMVLQFGYITLFASALPLAGALAFACNVLELLADAFKVRWPSHPLPFMTLPSSRLWCAHPPPHDLEPCSPCRRLP